MKILFEVPFSRQSYIFFLIRQDIVGNCIQNRRIFGSTSCQAWTFPPCLLNLLKVLSPRELPLFSPFAYIYPINQNFSSFFHYFFYFPIFLLFPLKPSSLKWHRPIRGGGGGYVFTIFTIRVNTDWDNSDSAVNIFRITTSMGVWRVWSFSIFNIDI